MKTYQASSEQNDVVPMRKTENICLVTSTSDSDDGEESHFICEGIT